MKTLRVQFKENGKEYNFNDTNAFTKVGDYVAVVTVNGFSVVRVTAIEDEFDPKHTPIISVVEASGLPECNVNRAFRYDFIISSESFNRNRVQ